MAESIVKYFVRSKKWLMKAVVYVVLAEFAYIFLLPLFYMVSTSAMSLADFLDSSVVWIPNAVHYENFKVAIHGLNAARALLNTTMLTLLCCAGQLLSCSITGYGFGRYRFPGSRLFFGLVLLTLLVPPQTIILSLYSLFKELGWINSYYPFVVPSFFAHGLRGALFILIFRQFFQSLPQEMEEAARLDGAGAVRVFATVMAPLAKNAFILTGMFSFIWNWNDYYQPSMFLNMESLYTIPMRILLIESSIYSAYGMNPDDGLDQPIVMAACVLIVAPLFLLYLFSQKYIKEGIQHTGMGGE